MLQAIRARTPARILVGRAGPAIARRQRPAARDHAAAVDAYRTRRTSCDGDQRAGNPYSRILDRCDKAGYLMRPDLGRRSTTRPAGVRRGCPPVAITGSDRRRGRYRGNAACWRPALCGKQASMALGVWSASTVSACAGWQLVRDPSVVVLLFGERPGLATAESLSAYLAFHPPGHTDARNLISNIHARGVPPQAAARASWRWPRRCDRCRRAASR